MMKETFFCFFLIFLSLVSILETGSLWISNHMYWPSIEDLIYRRLYSRWLAYIQIILVLQQNRIYCVHFIDKAETEKLIYPSTHSQTQLILVVSFLFNILCFPKKYHIINCIIFLFLQLKFYSICKSFFLSFFASLGKQLIQVKNSRRNKQSI